ncbi:dehydrogenase [Stappia sp. 22II-S9-Z10]|nr:dehydrogenase [Stappia sp. 22II-S9-Z10]
MTFNLTTGDMDTAQNSSMTVRQAKALWCDGRHRFSVRTAPSAAPGPGEVAIAAEHSAISRGTERLVAEGRVPASEAERMRCPFQEGDFPFPVKYGYALVGRIVAGPAARIGERVFALHPHQSLSVVPEGAAHRVPEDVPARRATLAANMETALNIVWDSGAAPGDRVLVIGAGVVGLCVAHILARMPAVTVTVVDRDPAKGAAAEAIGARFAAEPPRDVDVAINASGNGAALATAIEAAGVEARIVEASWLGEGETAVPLGGPFHARRLSIVSSQVGRLPAAKAPRWDFARRIAAALSLLADPRLDHLLTHSLTLSEAPAALPRLLRDDGPLAITLDYSSET